MNKQSEIIEWFVTGETATPAKVIAAKMAGIDHFKIPDYDKRPPTSPTELRSCLLFFRQFPDFSKRLHEMADVSAHWAKILPHWERAAELLMMEIGQELSKSRNAPRTYQFMQQVGF